MNYSEAHTKKWEKSSEEFKGLNRNALVYPVMLLSAGFILTFWSLLVGITIMIISILLHGHLISKVTQNLGYRDGLLDGMKMHTDFLKSLIKKETEKAKPKKDRK